MLNNIHRMMAQGPGQLRAVVILAAAALGAANGQAQVTNGDFSNPKIRGPHNFVEQAKTGWTTTDSKGVVEIWEVNPQQYLGKIFDAPPKTDIRQFAEVNAHENATLSQRVKGIKNGSIYGFSFWHRGRHSPTEADSIEVTVQDGTDIWTRTFSTTSEKWVNYAINVGTKKGNGDLVLSFKSVITASNDASIGNFLTGIKLDTTVAPPSCAVNAPGSYQWTTDNTKTKLGNGKLENLGIAKLNADNSALHNGRQGVWQITSDCDVVINWQKSKFIDTLRLSPDGKVLSGKNQIGTIITGKK